MSEPIAWFHEDDFSKGVSLHKDNFVNAIPLYAHPMRELSDEEILKIYDEVYVKNHNDGIDFARAIIKASRGEK